MSLTSTHQTDISDIARDYPNINRAKFDETTGEATYDKPHLASSLAARILKVVAAALFAGAIGAVLFQHLSGAAWLSVGTIGAGVGCFTISGAIIAAASKFSYKATRKEIRKLQKEENKWNRPEHTVKDRLDKIERLKVCKEELEKNELQKIEDRGNEQSYV